MGLISAIKSALGLKDSQDRAGGTDVTVERDPDAESERAVKETDPDAESEPAAEETDPEAAETGAGSGGSSADAGSADGSPANATPASPAEPPAEEAEPVEEVKGIGPAYAERLSEAGVETVADLSGADAADLAEASGIGEGRLETWIERAKAR